MTDYFQILPSVSLGKSKPPASPDPHEEPSRTSKKKYSTNVLSVNTVSRLVRGANDFLTLYKDEKAESIEREEARKLERKQILGLRMRNVCLSPNPPFDSVALTWHNSGDLGVTVDLSCRRTRHPRGKPKMETRTRGRQWLIPTGLHTRPYARS